MQDLLRVKIIINKKEYKKDIEPRMLLSDFIRNIAKLTGTHIGCDTSQCGTCIVHLNGEMVKSCAILAVQANKKSITTIEGIGDRENLHPMQKAFQKNHGLQCGFCTPGMIMAAIDLVNKETLINEQIVKKYLEGNLCRCTGYHNIVKSIIEGSKVMRS